MSQLLQCRNCERQQYAPAYSTNHGTAQVDKSEVGGQDRHVLTPSPRSLSRRMDAEQKPSIVRMITKTQMCLEMAHVRWSNVKSMKWGTFAKMYYDIRERRLLPMNTS